jgi:hypothetical protein
VRVTIRATLAKAVACADIVACLRRRRLGAVDLPRPDLGERYFEIEGCPDPTGWRRAA